MATTEERLKRLEHRSKEADIALKQLHLFIEVLKQKSSDQTSIPVPKSTAVQDLERENTQLRKEVERLKQILIQAEILNGISQIPNPQILPVESSTNLSDKSITKVEPVTVPGNDKETKPKKEKKEKTAPAAPGKDKIDVSRLDFRIGQIITVKQHPDADSLYVEEVELGEDKPRTVCSGLVEHISLQDMQNRMVVLLCNLKPVKMRGIVSEAMVMCASAPDKIEILDPPLGVVPGEKITFEGYSGTPDAQLNPKKKIFEQVQPDLMTNDEGVATYRGIPFTIPGKGVCKSQTLNNTIIK